MFLQIAFLGQKDMWLLKKAHLQCTCKLRVSPKFFSSILFEACRLYQSSVHEKMRAELGSAPGLINLPYMLGNLALCKQNLR